MNAISELKHEIFRMGTWTPEYYDKMMHDIPAASVVDRLVYILTKCAGKTVLHLGSASGDLHEAIKKVADFVVGVDKIAGPNTNNRVDLDESPESLAITGIELVVAGEIIEHLANPGNVLKALRKLNCEVLITVPNAFAKIGSSHVRKGRENVNRDHVAWYSYRTLRTLIERYGYELKEFYWYNGEPITAEGLIALVR